MALGEFPSLTQINTEIGTSGQSLSTCIANVGMTGTWDRQSDFAFYLHLFLTVDESSLAFDDTGAPTQTFNITSNVSWTITKTDSWILTSLTGGSGNSTRDVDCLNNFTAPRNGSITVSWSGTDRVITITQLGP